MNGLLTEREWRKQYVRKQSARPDWWGAQYVLPCARKNSLRKDRSFLVFLLLLSLTVSILLPALVPFEKETFVNTATQPVLQKAEPRSVSAVGYLLPAWLTCTQQTYTKEQLAQGKMMLLDERHRLPAEAPPPNTFSIASCGNGMVPVRDLSVKSGRETIAALKELFAALRAKGVSGLAVSQGTLSTAQQRAAQENRLRFLMKTQPVEKALSQVLDELDPPGTGELLQEYTVELQFQHSAPMQEQILTQTAWRYGFVQTDAAAHPDRFRYVGRAHAVAMTYLDLELEAYLEWLHQKGVMIISDGSRLQYLILCQPVSGTHVSFQIPDGTQAEVSLDNLGYAIAACTFS